MTLPSESPENQSLVRRPQFPNPLEMQLDFGDAAEEYTAATNEAAIFDVSSRTQITVTGTDRVKFLNNFCTNDLPGIPAGAGCPAYITNVKGRVLGQINIAVLEDSLIIDSVPGAATSILPHLERYIITEDVTLTDQTENTGKLFLTGPQSGSRLAAGLADPSVLNLEPFQHYQISHENSNILISRRDWFGTPGYLFITEQTHVAELNSLLEASGCKRAGYLAYEALRISSGYPCYGVDFSEGNLPQEILRYQDAVSFTKGCYLGQEPIARLDAMGHTNKQLVVLQLSLPESFDFVKPLQAEIYAPDGTIVGQLTSVATVPDEPTAYAMGFVKAGFQHSETVLSLRIQTEENFKSAAKSANQISASVIS